VRCPLTKFKGMTFLLAIVAGMAICSAKASVAVGENILINGALEADQLDFPQGWMTKRPSWSPTGGPNGMPCVTFVHDDERSLGEQEMKQSGIYLSPKGQYRISAWVCPRDGFRARMFHLHVSNKGGSVARGVSELPPIGRWTKISKEFSGFRSEGACSFAVSVTDFIGSIDIADLRLEALDEAAAAGAEKTSLSKCQSAPRIVPWGPLLGEIPKKPREVSFRLLGSLPAGIMCDGCDMILAADGSDSDLKQPLCAGVNRFRLPDGAAGGMMCIRVVNRATGEDVIKRMFRYRTVDVPSPDNLKKHRRLNNFVTEVMHENVPACGAGSFSFGIARRKWVFISVKSAAVFSLSLDGEKVVDAATPRHEAFREVAPGDHGIDMEGAAAGDEITVRTIPEILNYAPYKSHIGEMPPYDWKYQEKYAFPAVTTLNGGLPPDGPEMETFRASGRRWLANLKTTRPKSPDDIAERLKSAQGMTHPMCDGVTCDEQFCGRDDANFNYMLGLRRYDLEEKPTRGIYTWLVGKPISGIFDSEYLAECANVSLGRGAVILETYCRSRSREKDALAYFEAYICETMRQYRKAWPEIPASMGMILGNFVQIPVLSLHHHCETDYRYFLDMQLNTLANNPELDGMGVAGYYGSHNQDEDTFRWSFKLLRHYCVDGGTEMLSGKFGLKFNPGFVKNPDFRSGLDEWRSEGNIAHDSVKEFGKRSLGMLQSGGGGCGDNFAVFVRGDGPNRIWQRMSGFVPGETYKLQFVTFDANDAKAHRFAPRRIALNAELGDGARILPDLSWVHVDRRAKIWRKANTEARINLNYIVFEAKAPEIELSFTDAAAKPGERLGLNWIFLAKYLK